MLEKSIKSKNPFSNMGKIYKYEFKNLCRSLFPFFAAILLIGLCIGLSFPTIEYLKKDNLSIVMEKYENNEIDYTDVVNGTVEDAMTEDDSAEEDYSFSSERREKMFVIFTLLLNLASLGTFIFLVLSTDKRIKNSFKEDEAYMTFSLPVSVSSHIAGRLLCYTTFFLLWGISVLFAVALSFIKYYSVPFFKMTRYGLQNIYINPEVFNYNMPFFIFSVIIAFIVIYILLISLEFYEKAIVMRLQHYNKFISFCLVILEIAVFIIIQNKLIKIDDFLLRLWIALAFNVIFIVMNIAITTFVFKKRINLE